MRDLLLMQQNIPVTITYSHELSPPHHGLMSPYQSAHTQHYMAPITNSRSTSPEKPRGPVPTAPTHLAAMRNRNCHQSFDFLESLNPLVEGYSGMQGMQGMFTNLPPLSGNNEDTNSMTPFPIFPAWSSATSPQSKGEAVWGDKNLHSPPNQMNTLEREEDEQKLNYTETLV